MSPEEIARLRALIVAATPGPWVGFSNHSAEQGQPRPEHGCSVDSSADATVLVAAGRQLEDGRMYDCCVTDDIRMLADAAFIAAARQALPAALDEVERLCAEVKRLNDRLYPPAATSPDEW